MSTSQDDRAEQDQDGAFGADGPEEEDRAAILRRRAKFIASAIAGLSILGATACDGVRPQPCLDIAVPEDAGDSGSTTGDCSTGGSGAAGSGGAAGGGAAGSGGCAKP